MRKKIVAGNWKMNKTFEEAEDLLIEINEGLIGKNLGNTEVVVCPPYLYLELANDAAKEGQIKVGSQNVFEKEFGAFTGEISAPMLQSLNIDYCIIGHSERRQYFHEINQQLAEKIILALKFGITPIFCCGERLEEREQERYLEVVEKQLKKSVFQLEKKDFNKLVIAYEPVWAIGTGVNATPEQAEEMHYAIRQLILKKYGKETADNISILYGGSCNPKNSGILFSLPDVDGGLIGGASLNAIDFLDIVKSATEN